MKIIPTHSAKVATCLAEIEDSLANVEDISRYADVMVNGERVADLATHEKGMRSLRDILHLHTDHCYRDTHVRVTNAIRNAALYYYKGQGETSSGLIINWVGGTKAVFVDLNFRKELLEGEQRYPGSVGGNVKFIETVTSAKVLHGAPLNPVMNTVDQMLKRLRKYRRAYLCAKMQSKLVDWMLHDRYFRPYHKGELSSDEEDEDPDEDDKEEDEDEEDEDEEDEEEDEIAAGQDENAKLSTDEELYALPSVCASELHKNWLI